MEAQIATEGSQMPSQAHESGLVPDAIDYKVRLHRPLKTSDGRTFNEVELKPVTTGDYEMVMHLDDMFAQAKKIITNQLQINEEDLRQLDNRDTNRMIKVIAHFLPFSLL